MVSSHRRERSSQHESRAGRGRHGFCGRRQDDRVPSQPEGPRRLRRHPLRSHGRASGPGGWVQSGPTLLPSNPCRTAHHGPASIAESDFSNFLLEDKLEEEQDMFIGGCPARLRSASGSGHAAYRGIDGGYVHAKDQQSALPVGLVWRRDGFFLKCALLGK
jgi:hypothetical protein